MATLAEFVGHSTLFSIWIHHCQALVQPSRPMFRFMEYVEDMLINHHKALL